VDKVGYKVDYALFKRFRKREAVISINDSLTSDMDRFRSEDGDLEQVGAQITIGVDHFGK
jgi:hypothetical protein